MTTGLYELLGIDAEDPAVLQADEDAGAYADLITILVGLRKQQDLSQKNVARDMGTTQSAVSDLERVGGDPRYSTLQRYARAVGCKLKTMAVVDKPQITYETTILSFTVTAQSGIGQVVVQPRCA